LIGRMSPARDPLRHVGQGTLRGEGLLKTPRHHCISVRLSSISTTWFVDFAVLLV
jgi:hypothetical protein